MIAAGGAADEARPGSDVVERAEGLDEEPFDVDFSHLFARQSDHFAPPSEHLLGGAPERFRALRKGLQVPFVLGGPGARDGRAGLSGRRSFR